MRFQFIKTQQMAISAVCLAATPPIIHPNIGAKMRNLLTRGKTNLRLAAGGLVLAALSACGGGTSTDNGTGDATSGGPGNSPVTVSGRVADGYINGAIVFWDCNDNLTLDDGEISVRSASGGAFTIPVASSEVCKLRAEIPSTAIDEDTNLPIGRSLTMAAVDGHPEFISPLTTLAALGVATEAELKAKFLGNTTIAITDDYIAAGLAGVPMHNAARYSALALQAVGGNIKTSDADGRKQLLSIAVSILPNEAWVSQTPVLQSALDNFLGTIPKLSTNNILSGSPSSIEFILNESAFNGVNDPRRATVKKALDALKDYPYVVVGSNIRWRALPSSVLASFGPGLADKSLFPATPEETVVRDRIFVALQEAQTANAAGLKNVNRAVGATFFKNAIDMSLTSVNSALTLVPAAGYVKNAVFFNTNIAKLKKASAISKEAANRLGDFVSLIQECGNLANDLTYLSVAPDLMSITDLKDPAVNLTKCVAGMMGSDKVKAIVDAINLGSTTGGAAYDGELIKLLKALSDVTSLSLDLAQLSVPAAMYNETFGMLITSINAVLEINQSADAQDLIFEALLKDISAKFNAVAAREGEVLIATRLKPYITTLGNQFTFTHSLAVINAISTFNITGTNLPATAPLDITFNGCANIQFVSQSAAQHQFTCTPTVADTLTAVIRTLPGTTPLGSFPVVVSVAGGNSGSFSVAANLAQGVPFTVPPGVASCVFNTTGAWALGFNMPTVNADGNGPGTALSGLYMYPGAAAALIALRNGVYIHIGISKVLPVVAGETLTFTVNDYPNSHTDNSGALSVSWQCTTAGGSINISATSFINGLNVALSANGYGADTLMNAPPYGAVANAAEWVVNAPPGRYELFATYASGLSRPVTISFDGTTMFTNALAAGTGGFFPANRQTLSQGIVQLPTGANIMRVTRADVFPHINGFTLVPVSLIEGSFQVNANAPLGAAFVTPSGVTSCTFSATGSWFWASGLSTNANGNSAYSNSSAIQLLPTSPYFSLIANSTAGYRFIGASQTISLVSGQALSFMINEGIGPDASSYSDNSGSLLVSYTCH